MARISLPIRYGLFICAGLIAYFLILSLFGLHTNPIFSLGNGVIVTYGIYAVLKHHKAIQADRFEYSDTFSVGIATGFAGTMFFTFFFALYASNINPTFLDKLIAQWEQTYSTSLGNVVFMVALMGFSTTVVVTLAFMQLFKESWNPKRQIKK